MNKMVVANLVNRPMRTLISVIAIAVEVTLILVVVGLLRGYLDDVKQRQTGIGADILVQPNGSSFLIGVSDTPAPIKVADVLRKVEHVKAVAPVIMKLNTDKAVEIIYGIDLDSFQAVGGPFIYRDGGPFQEPHEAKPGDPSTLQYDILVDDIFAKSNKVKVGDTIEKLSHDFRVAGIVEHGKGARLYLQLKTLQDLLGAADKASVFYVKLDRNTPEDVKAAEAAIKTIQGMDAFKVRSMEEWMSLTNSDSLPGFAPTVDVVIAVAMIIGFIVIFQAMYTAVMERTREIGILKSLGATKLYIVNLMLREAVLLGVVGTVLGFGVSFAARALIHKRLPSMHILIGNDWLGYAAVIAIVGAVLGAVYPALKAAQKDPVDALAYE